MPLPGAPRLRAPGLAALRREQPPAGVLRAAGRLLRHRDRLGLLGAAPRPGGVQDVLLADPPADSCAGYGPQVDPVLCGELAHERRHVRAVGARCELRADAVGFLRACGLLGLGLLQRGGLLHGRGLLGLLRWRGLLHGRGLLLRHRRRLGCGLLRLL